MEGNQQKMREAVVALLYALDSIGCDEETATLAAFVPDMADSSAKCLAAFRKAKEALSEHPHKGKWENGTMYEYEYAYCSECGRMQWAGWDTHKQAEEEIESFANDYKFCPGCGAEMEGGVYVQ